MDAGELFQKVCAIIEQSPQDVNPISFKTFIATLKPLTFKDNTLYLIAPSDMHRRCILFYKTVCRYKYPFDLLQG